MTIFRKAIEGVKSMARCRAAQPYSYHVTTWTMRLELGELTLRDKEIPGRQVLVRCELCAGTNSHRASGREVMHAIADSAQLLDRSCLQRSSKHLDQEFRSIGALEQRTKTGDDVRLRSFHIDLEHRPA